MSHAAPTPVTPVAKRRLALLLLLASFVLWFIPVLVSRTDRDPVYDQFTDFLRYRYCSRLVLDHPLEALTTPLATLAARDPHPDRLLLTRHQGYLWEQHPCHPGGLLHVGLHAPFQMVVDGGWLSSLRTSQLYIGLMLGLVHVTLWLIGRGGQWGIALFLYPWLIRSSLYLVETPLTFLLAYLAARAWARGARPVALLWFALALSGYVRWVVWLPALAVLAWTERGVLREQLRPLLASRKGLTLALLTALLTVQALAAFALVSGHFPSTLDPGVAHRPLALLASSAVLVGWGLHRARHPESQLALLVLCFAAFLLAYRELTLFWYLAPLLAAFPFARTAHERVAWAGTSVFLGELAIGPTAHHSLLAFRDLGAWVVKTWIRL